MTAFLDTNVLLYAISRASEDAQKRDRAWEIIDGGDIALSLQVVQEFLYQAGRPGKGHSIPREIATGFVDQWRRFAIQETTLALLDEGLVLQARHRFSFWDSMIVAAAKAQGCDILWTEDMDDGRIIDGLRIANPFR